MKHTESKESNEVAFIGDTPARGADDETQGREAVSNSTQASGDSASGGNYWERDDVDLPPKEKVSHLTFAPNLEQVVRAQAQQASIPEGGPPAVEGEESQRAHSGGSNYWERNHIDLPPKQRVGHLTFAPNLEQVLRAQAQQTSRPEGDSLVVEGGESEQESSSESNYWERNDIDLPPKERAGHVSVTFAPNLQAELRVQALVSAGDSNGKNSRGFEKTNVADNILRCSKDNLEAKQRPQAAGNPNNSVTSGRHVKWEHKHKLRRSQRSHDV